MTINGIRQILIMKSGNINSKIENIQIKIIPKGVIKDDFLHDYIENKNDINIGFDGV